MITLTAIKAFGVAVTIFNGVKTAILAAKAAVIAMNVAMLANPAGIMIAGFALVIAMITTSDIQVGRDKGHHGGALGVGFNRPSRGLPGLIDTFVLGPIRAIFGALAKVWEIMQKVFGGSSGTTGTTAGAPTATYRKTPGTGKRQGAGNGGLAGNKNSATIVAAENSKAANGAQPSEIKNNVDVNVHPQEINVYIDKNKVGKGSGRLQR